MRKIPVVVLLVLAAVLTMFGCGEPEGTELLKINGTEITQFQIIYAEDPEDDHAKVVAKDLGKRLSEKYGVKFVVATDKNDPTEYEIIIGNTARDVSGYAPVLDQIEKYSISSDGSHVAITAGGHKGMAAAVEEFIELIGLEKPAEETPEAVTIGAGEVKESKLYSAMSFNVLYSYDENRWPLVIDIILKYMPDTIGMQEAGPTWQKYFSSTEKFTEHYEIITFQYPDDPDHKVQELVCYRKDRFKKISAEIKSLSNTPDVAAMLDGLTAIRNIGIVVLEDLETGEQIVHANTHVDAHADSLNVTQVECMKKILEPYRGKKVIVTGDFNSVHNDGDGLGSEDTYFYDAKYHADYATKRPTFGNRSTAIDFCWFARDTIDAKYYHVATEMLPFGDGSKKRYPSDHRPVYIVYDLLSD